MPRQSKFYIFGLMKFFKIVFFLIGVFVAVGVHAQSSDELKRRRDKYNEDSVIDNTIDYIINKTS